MIGITVLGATGSIGVNTLDVIARHPDRYRVVALTANQDVERMLEQCRYHRPEYAVMASEAAATQLDARIRQQGPMVQVLQGVEGLCRVASLPQVSIVMAAIVGAAGLLPSMAAAAAGKRILLANKEALVMSGRLFMDQVQQGKAELLPVDSEHNAVFQCMTEGYTHGLAQKGVRQILLTASGGPFRTRKLSELDAVTPEEACAHPNWVMGRKISVDSATMMNKGLEVIEACWLFNASPDQVQVVLHPQSVIHSMVEYVDGSVLAQLGSPDMRTPIAHALAWPERIESGVKRLDLVQVGQLSFERTDFERFPCLRLAYEAMRRGGTATAVLNAANEVAVTAFLERRLRFNAIADVIEHTLGACSVHEADSLDVVLTADQQARQLADEMINTKYR
ncbi:MAG: 1-deoxy-D-xylulose-5-phosphate reductoisomerase [Gammaproteobacteria bacterium]|nr:1-deoxy-D-xylulose-5-phosphate reductoisomerase [Gammaproteobacteria bacterium]